jgi:hypothetical protein
MGPGVRRNDPRCGRATEPATMQRCTVFSHRNEDHEPTPKQPLAVERHCLPIQFHA